MVILASGPTEHLHSAIDELLQSGIKPNVINSMVAERIEHHTIESPGDIIDLLDAGERRQKDADVIYRPGELPPGLIDLPSASRKYGIPNSTLRRWIRVGRLPRKGRLRGSAPGGGYVVTVDDAIPYCRDHPRKRGPKCKQTS